MILDNDTLFAEDAAFGDTPVILDLGNSTSGPGEKLKCFFQGSSDLAGVTGIDVLSDDNATPVATVLSVVGDPADKITEFELPNTIGRYVTIALAGAPSVGTFTSGIVLPGVQTNL